MELLRTLFTYLMSLISLEPPVPTGSELPDGSYGRSFDVVAFFYMIQESLYGGGKWLLDTMLDHLHPVLDFHALTLDIWLIMVMVCVIYWTIALLTKWAKKRTISRMDEEEKRKLEMLLADILQQEGNIYMLEQEHIVLQHEKEHLELLSVIRQDQWHDAVSTPLASGPEHHESEVKCVPRSEKPMTWKAEEGKRSNDILKKQHEKEDLELQSVIMQEELEAKDQWHDAVSAPLASGSEHHESEVKCVPRSEKPMTWKAEEGKRSNDILKIQHEKEDLELQSVIMQEELEAKDQWHDAVSTPLASGSEHHESEVKCVSRSEKPMALKAEEGKRSNDILKKQHEKEDLKLQSIIMQEELEAKDQWHDAVSTLQASGPEHHESEVTCVPRSEKPMTWKTEEGKRSNDILKIQHEKEDLELQSVIMQEELKAKDQCQEADSAPQASGPEHHESEVKCVPRSEKPMTWKAEEGKRSNDILKKQHEKEDLELQSVIMQEELEAKDQWHDAVSTPQASGSEHHESEVKCVPRSEKPMTWKTEERKRSNDILKKQHEKEDLELQSIIIQEELEAKDQWHDAVNTPLASGSEHHESEVTCVPRSEKPMTWKTEEGKRSNDILKIQHEKGDLKLQSIIMQEKLEAKDQCQEADSAPQASGSEHHEPEVKCVPRSEKLMTWKTEERKRSNDILKMQMELHKKRAEESLICIRVAELTLATEREENAKLRQKFFEVNAELAELRDPVTVPPLKKDGIASCRLGKAALEESTEKLQGEKILQLEDKIKTMENDRASLNNDITNQGNLYKILQEKLLIMDTLCQEKDYTLQQMLAQEEVEQHVKHIKSAGPKKEVRNFKQRIQEIDAKHEKALDSLKKEISFHKKTAEDNLVVAFASKSALTAKRKEVAILSKKLSEFGASMAGYQEPVVRTTSGHSDPRIRPLNKDGTVMKIKRVAVTTVDKSTQAQSSDQLQWYRCQAELAAELTKVERLGAKIGAMEEEREALRKEMLKLAFQNRTSQKEVQSLNEQCKEKDQALQQKTARVDFERRDKELKVKEVLKVHKLKVQSIVEEHQKSELSYKAEIASLKKSQHKLMKTCASRPAQMTNLYKQREVDSRAPSLATPDSCQETPREKKTIATQTPFLASAKMRAKEEEHEAIRKEMLKLAFQNRTFQKEVQSLTEQCKQKDQALQQKTARMDFERRDKELKVKEVLKVHKLKVQSIVEEHQKSELSYKAEIASLKKSQDKLMKTCASRPAQMTNLYKQREVDSRAPSLATPDSCQETPREKKTIATQTPFRGCLNKSKKLPNAAEDKQSLHIKKLQLEEKRSQHLEEKIRTLEQNRNALMSEKSQLEDQTAALQTELLFANERFEQRAQSLQLSALLEDVELEAEIQALALNVRVMREELESHGRYKARMEFQEQQAQENMTIALDISEAQAEAIAYLQNELGEANAKLAVLWKADPAAGPSFSYQALPLPLYDSEDVPLPGLAARSPGFSGTHLSPPLPSLGEFEHPRPPDLYDIGGFREVEFGETEGWERGGEAE